MMVMLSVLVWKYVASCRPCLSSSQTSVWKRFSKFLWVFHCQNHTRLQMRTSMNFPNQ